MDGWHNSISSVFVSLKTVACSTCLLLLDE
jgi:hypothetical protein